MGREGEVVAGAGARLRARESRHPRAGAADPVDGGAREAADRARRRRDARRRAARQHLDRRVRGARRARAARRHASPHRRRSRRTATSPASGTPTSSTARSTACRGTSTRACCSIARDLLAEAGYDAMPHDVGGWRDAMRAIKRARRARAATRIFLPTNEWPQPVDPRAAGRLAAAADGGRARRVLASRRSARAFDFYSSSSATASRPRSSSTRSPTSTRSSRAARSRCTSPAPGTSASSSGACRRTAGRVGHRAAARARPARVGRLVGRRLEPRRLPRRRSTPGGGVEADRVPVASRAAGRASTQLTGDLPARTEAWKRLAARGRPARAAFWDAAPARRCRCPRCRRSSRSWRKRDRAHRSAIRGGRTRRTSRSRRSTRGRSASSRSAAGCWPARERRREPASNRWNETNARGRGCFLAPGAGAHRRLLLPAGCRHRCCSASPTSTSTRSPIRPTRASSGCATTRTCSTTRCSGRRCKNTFYFALVGGPLSVAVSLGAALLVNARVTPLQAVLPHASSSCRS